MATDRGQDADRPSRAEIQRRVNALYDRAESDTGTFNATRAMSSTTRRGTGAVRGRRASGDPGLDAVARQWFDGVRGRLGPTVPAVLPRDRMPERPAVAPGPPRSPERPVEAPWARELESAERRVPELTARAVAALPAAPATALLDPAADTAVLPAVPETAVPAAAAPAFVPPARGGLPSLPEPGSPAPALDTFPSVEPPPTAQPLLTIDPLPTAEPPLSARSLTSEEPPATAEAWLGTGALPAVEALPAVDPLPAFEPLPSADPLPPAAASLPTETAWSTGELPLYDPVGAQVWPTPREQWAHTGEIERPDTGTFPATSFTGGGLPASAPLDATVTPHAVTVTPPAVSGYGMKAEKAVAFARAQIGKPCVWGAKGPGSYDCSSLTQAAWKTAGVSLPRTAAEQARIGTAVDLADLLPGDLVFFFGGLQHTGLYTGNGMMIHAPGPGAFIREESIHHAGPDAIRGAVRPA